MMAVLKMIEDDSLVRVTGLPEVFEGKEEGSSLVEMNVLKTSGNDLVVTVAVVSEVSEDREEEDLLVEVTGLPEVSKGEDDETETAEVAIVESLKAQSHEAVERSIDSVDESIGDTKEGDAVDDANSVTEISTSVSVLEERVITTVCGAVV